MRIRAGYELAYECPQPTPMLLMLNIHPSRRPDLLTEQVLRSRRRGARDYVDGFGNVCTRIVAPAGRMTIATTFVIYDSGEPDVVRRDAAQHDIRDLPDEVLVFLLGSRYCDTDRLGDFAWAQFGEHAAGLGAGAGDLRLRARPHRLRLPARRPTRTAYGRPITTGPASAATSRISRSRSAAA